MSTIDVVVDETTLARSSGGSITGVLTLAADGWVYPEAGWSDFPVVVLSWWLHACQRVGSRVGASAECRFMDGGFSFQITSINEGEWLLECISDQGKGFSYSCVIPAQSFIRSLKSAAVSVVRTCRSKGWESKAIEDLQSYV